MDHDQIDVKADALYKKIRHWIEWQPGWQLGDPKWPDAIRNHTRIEVIKAAHGALEITVEAPDQFSVQAPRETPKSMNEQQMLEAAKRWLGFADYPPNGAAD
jgi:hypothetical protein